MSNVATAPLILPLDAPAASVALVGGKGASLARMAAAGLPVPPGFLLTTEAYRRFVQANDLQPSIDAAASGAAADDPAALDRASGAIASLFQGGAMPAAVDGALRRAYAALGGEPAVAARSSATAEDLPEFSFAGQQETVLNVRGGAALVAATRRCWESLWTARAIGYRRRMEIDQRTVAMGVVVQTMLAPSAAGVVFTANPSTGDRGELLVNASYGLGEAIVSGQVTPDSYVLERATLGVTERTIGEKAVEIVAAPGQGTTSEAVPLDRRQRPALSDEQLRRLGELAIEVETLFGGAPQDIEWAFADGRFWLLQARPITNLPPAPLAEARWEPPTPGTAWIRRQVVEHMPGPLSPLFEELYLEEGAERAADALMAAMGISGAFLEMLERPFLTTVNGYAYMRASYNFRWKHVPGFLRYTASAIAMVFGSAIPLWRDQALPAYLTTIARWQAVDPAAAPDQELLAGVRELAWADAAYWWSTALVVGAAKISDAVLDRFLALALPGRGLSSAMFLRGFPSTLRDAETTLETIAAQIRADEAARTLVAATPARDLLAALAKAPAGQAPLRALRDYLARYGHQIYTLDFVEPTLGEETLPIALSLKALVEHPGQTALERQAALAEERDRLTAETERSLDPLRRFFFRRVVRWAQRFAPYREEALFYVGAAWPTLRRLALELGRRLADAGSLAAADDIFFLRTTEIEAAIAAGAAGGGRSDLARLAEERRALREARQRLHPPAAVPPDYRYTFGPFDISGFETQRRNALASATLVGFPVSPGRVTAPASVIRSPAEFGSMEPGTILVCPTTTPAWTPFFAQARGLVTDIGGILAHGSIVAREYGIPAVMGTGNATQRIASGETVTVDGDAGTVTLLGTERT